MPPSDCAQVGPVHAPPAHEYAHGEPAATQAPDVLHVCGCWPLHWVDPGTQLPPHAPGALPAAPMHA